VNRILSSTVKLAGLLAVVGGVMAAATAPATTYPSPTSGYGIAAFGSDITIYPVAYTGVNNTAQVAGPVVYPGFLTTGGILDRASYDRSYSQVGAVKVYGMSQVDQLNASMVSTSCRSNSSGPEFGDATIQAGSIVAPDLPFFPPIPLIRNPAPNTVITLGDMTVTLNQQKVKGTGVNARLTVIGIFIRVPGQNLSIAVSRCGPRPS
jgi:hypothetical protein